jgi:hypothetical protein
LRQIAGFGLSNPWGSGFVVKGQWMSSFNRANHRHESIGWIALLKVLSILWILLAAFMVPPRGGGEHTGSAYTTSFQAAMGGHYGAPWLALEQGEPVAVATNQITAVSQRLVDPDADPANLACAMHPAGKVSAIRSPIRASHSLSLRPSEARASALCM